MKRTVLLTICLVWIVAGFSQRPEKLKSTPLDEVTLVPLNADYSMRVIDQQMPPSVKNLERRAARFDVRDLRAYNRNYDVYEVLFKENNGSIIATYDQEGRILESHEKFRNIALPPKVRNYLYLEYPGWIISKDVYFVSYYNDGEILKTCKVQLTKGKQKRHVNLNISML